MNCNRFFVGSIAETAMLSQYQSLLNDNWPFKNFITVWTFLGRSYDSDKCFQFYKGNIGNLCLLLCNQRISKLTKISILLQHTASRLQCIWWKNIANCVFLEISSGCKINKKKLVSKSQILVEHLEIKILVGLTWTALTSNHVRSIYLSVTHLGISQLAL